MITLANTTPCMLSILTLVLSTLVLAMGVAFSECVAGLVSSLGEYIEPEIICRWTNEVLQSCIQTQGLQKYTWVVTGVVLSRGMFVHAGVYRICTHDTTFT